MKKIIIAAIVSLSLALVSCGKVNSAKTFVYGMSKEPMNLDPAVVSDTASNFVLNNVCEGLVGYGGKLGTEVVPKLASSWDISSDEKTYTFHLREGVKFHDGTNVDADAVLFSLLRQHDKKHPYYKLSYSYWISTGFAENIFSIDKTEDGKNIIVKLKYPDGTFLAKMALAMADVISPTAYKKLGDNFNKDPVCSGRFIFKKWEKAQSLLLVKNDNYWDKSKIPKVDNLILKIIPDSSARLLSLKKGELDLAEKINPPDVKSLEENPHLQIVLKPDLYEEYLWFNVEHKPFDDVRVRKAVAHLIDKQKLIDNALLGYGKIEKTPFPQSLFGHDDDMVDYEYNVEKAKQLLAEAGYPNGFEMDILYNKESNDRKAVAEMLQSFFAEANIKVHIKNSEWGTFINDTAYRKNTGASISGWGGDYADPDNFLSMNFSKKSTIKPALNVSGWYNDEFDKYNEEAVRLTDQKQRAAIYKKSQAIFHEEVPVIPLYQKETLWGIKKDLKDLVYKLCLSVTVCSSD